MRVSVIIPTYRPGHYIWDCLDSLYEQSLPKDSFEVIVVLNGCNEPFYSEIQDYICCHAPLNWNLIQTDTAGVSNARNIALDLIRGEYVTFIDDDDYVSPRYLECLLDCASKDCVSVSDTYSFLDGTSDMKKDYKAHRIFVNRMGKKNSINTLKFFFQGPVRKLLHRSILDGRRFDNAISNGEDSLYMFLISNRINKVVLSSPDAVYYRRIRTDSANYRKQSFLAIVRNRLYLIKEYTKIYIKNPLEYNLIFYFTRLLGSIRTIINNII